MEHRTFPPPSAAETFLVTFAVGIRSKPVFSWAFNSTKEYGSLSCELKIGRRRPYRRMLIDRTWLMPLSINNSNNYYHGKESKKSQDGQRCGTSDSQSRCGGDRHRGRYHASLRPCRPLQGQQPRVRSVYIRPARHLGMAQRVRHKESQWNPPGFTGYRCSAVFRRTGWMSY